MNTSQPPNYEYFGDYYDGERALAQRVAVREDHGDYGDVLVLDVPDGQNVVLWPCNAVRTLPDQSNYDTLTIGLDNNTNARLVLRDPVACAMVARACPNLGIPMRPPSKWRQAITAATIGAVSVAALILVVLPMLAGVLAGVTNVRAELKMGETHFELTRSAFSPNNTPLQFCAAPDGIAAMNKITARIADGVSLPYPLKVAVLDDRANQIPNAYALPGGYITFFDSLIQLSESPDEIAAVFAHELGHVVLNHSVASVLERMTTFVIVSLLSGDFTGAAGLGAGIISSGFSRAAETEADVYAQERLTDVGLPPAALGGLFARMSEEHPEVTGVLAHLSSHPEMAARIQAAASADTGTATAPALSDVEWQALRDICSVLSDDAP